MRGYMLESFKIMNEISNRGRHFLNISPRTGRRISKSQLQTGFIFNRII